MYRRRGVEAEIAFESRLISLGYYPVCRPSRMDDGVDFVIFTTKGWLGIQVKRGCMNPNKKQRRSRIRYIPMLQLDRGSHKRGERDLLPKTYYASRGVSVFAVYTNGGFYLIPIAAISGEHGSNLKQHKPFWEAWSEVLGFPVDIAAADADINAEAEIQQIEMMWDTPPSPQPSHKGDLK